MSAIIFSLFSSIWESIRSRAALQAEIFALRHQLLVLQLTARGRKLDLRWADRVLWIWLFQLWNDWRSALLILKLETVIAWHRRGFRLYWRWKSRHPQGRPCVPQGVIDPIRKMSLANPRWGAPRIHGELLKLGLELSAASVAKYMVRHRKPPSQTWRTFLANHMKDIVSSDFFVVPTVFFRVFFVFVILSHDRRRPVHVAVYFSLIRAIRYANGTAAGFTFDSIWAFFRNNGSSRIWFQLCRRRRHFLSRRSIGNSVSS